MLIQENPGTREIKKLAKKATEVEVHQASNTPPGYWEVWAEINGDLDGIGQWPTQAIDELARMATVHNADAGALWVAGNAS